MLDRNDAVKSLYMHIESLQSDVASFMAISHGWPKACKAQDMLKRVMRDYMELKAHSIALMQELERMDTARRNMTGESSPKHGRRDRDSSGVLPRQRFETAKDEGREVLRPREVEEISPGVFLPTSSAPPAQETSGIYLEGLSTPPEPKVAAPEPPAADPAPPAPIPEDKRSIGSIASGLSPELLAELRKQGMK